MAATVLKEETEVEICCVCNSSGELMSPEEYDANNGAAIQVPLRTMLLHLNNNKVVPEGRLCGSCIQRAVEAYEFSSALANRAAPALGDKVRALRRRLHELTQKIDVFIVVGAPGAGPAASYSEDDIILVEKYALAAAAAADDDDLQHARNARGDTVYQCSVCPLSFSRSGELRAHLSTHPADSLHSCWTCGAQFQSRDALHEHADHHTAPAQLNCNLCGLTFSCQSDLRRHERTCTSGCPACSISLPSRPELSAHVAAVHGRAGPPPYVCPACFMTFTEPDLLSAHKLKHRQARQFVCGYGSCVLRFSSRGPLLQHIRRAHSDDLPPPAPPAPAPPQTHDCNICQRTFASSAALKRHMHTHTRAENRLETKQEILEGDTEEVEMEMEVLGVEAVVGEEGEGVEQIVMEQGEGEVEYLEVETLDEAELLMQQ